jgi:DNA invertase Pin-like site-specific DNA recombinase
MPEEITVLLREALPSEQYAAQVLEMVKGGASLSAVSATLGITWVTAKNALEFARSGEALPPSRPTDLSDKHRTSVPPYVVHAEEVARLHHQEEMSFKKIAARLGIHEATAWRAYDWSHRDELVDATGTGQRPRRGGFSHLGGEKKREVRRLLEAGRKLTEVARQVGCSVSTVKRTKLEMKKEGRAPSS